MIAPLTIELETSEVRVGDTVRGRVHVHETFASAEGLDVKLVYTLRSSTITRVEERVAFGPVHEGQVIPFELTLVDAPYSWDMPNVSVRWTVQASVDVAWSIDPKTSAPLVVRAREVGPDEALLAQLSAQAAASQPEQELGAVGNAFLAILLAFFVLAMFPLLPIVLIFWARSAITRTRVRDLELVLPERRVAHGEWFPVIVRFSVRRPFHLAHLELSFSGSERWTTGSGDSRRSHREVFLSESQTILRDRIVALGAEEARGGGGGAYRGGGRARPRRDGPVFEWQTGFRLPAHGPPSGSGSLTYDLKVDLDIEGLPDVSKTARLQTLGARVHPLPPAGDPPPPELTSGELSFLKPGESVPPGVNARLGSGGLMRWVLLSFVGVALGIGGIIGLAAGAALAAIPFALGGALLALSVGAFLWTLYR